MSICRSTALHVLLYLCSAAVAFAAGARVGSKTCFGCHQEIYRSFVKTDMGRSMRFASELDSAKLPEKATLPLGNSGRSVEVYRDQNAWYQTEIEPNVFRDTHRLEYAVGSGANGMTFLVRRGDYLFQAPLSYYTRTASWDFSPGYQQQDLGFSRAAPETCLRCHSGGLRTGANGTILDPPFSELAIGCENCHGPGEQHVQSLGRKAGSIVNPARLPARLAEDICVNCHQQGDALVLQKGKCFADFLPGQPVFETFAIFSVPREVSGAPKELLQHDQAMKASKCFRASAGKLSCFSCHDPHIQPRGMEAAAFFRARCLRCHSETSCRLPRAQRAATSPPDNCVTCHMPKRSVAEISHSVLTNHRIPASPDKPVTLAKPDIVNDLVLLDPPYKADARFSDPMLLRAYGELSGPFPEYQARYSALLGRLRDTMPQDPSVQAALGHTALIEGKNQEALEHLRQALSIADATIYTDLAKAASALGLASEAIDYLKRGIATNPYDQTLRKMLILDYINGKRYAEARQGMTEYVDLFPEDAFMRGLLARVGQ